MDEEGPQSAAALVTVAFLVDGGLANVLVGILARLRYVHIKILLVEMADTI